MAVIGRDFQSSYGAVRARAGALAVALVDSGVVPGDRVAICLERGPDDVAAIAAASAVGAVVVVLNERLRTPQVAHMLATSGARALLSTSGVLVRLGAPLETTARVLDVDEIPAAASFAPRPLAADAPAQVIFTSGSTGRAKGVCYRAGALSRGVRHVATYLGLSADDRIAGQLPPSSVYGLHQVLATLATGATLVVERSPMAAEVIATLAAHGTTVLAGVPPLWAQWLAHDTLAAAHWPALRQLQNAGGRLPVGAVRALRERFPGAELVLQYGSTEAGRSTFVPSALVDAAPDRIGRAMPGVEIVVVDDAGRVVADGDVGELVHVGDTIADGYWNDAEASARVFRADPRGGAQRAVFTGDLVVREADGLLRWVARRDHVIKSLGFRVSPDEVSEALAAAGETSDIAVVGERDDERGEAIIAWVVLRAGAELRRLERFSRSMLPRHMQPARFVVVDAIPQLPGGKHDLDALRRGLGPPAAGA